MSDNAVELPTETNAVGVNRRCSQGTKIDGSNPCWEPSFLLLIIRPEIRLVDGGHVVEKLFSL
jgi:hypothetical protein